MIFFFLHPSVVVALIVCGGRGIRYLFYMVVLGALSSLAIVLLRTIELAA